MQILQRPRVIFVDVDGTLIVNGRLNKPLVDRLKRKYADGFALVLWSMRGREHAYTEAAKHGVADLFAFIISKPGEIIDDRGTTWLKGVKITKA